MAKLNFFALRLTTVFNIDWAMAFASMGNLVALVTGPITVLLITTYFSSELQGYYYTFNSLIAIRFLAELGLGQTLVHVASHEWSLLELNTKTEIRGDPTALERLKYLYSVSFRWYGIGSAIIVPILVLLGYMLFSVNTQTTIDWKLPWITLCISTGLGFLLLPIFSILQGCGQVSQFWFYRFVQQILSNLSLWVVLLLGGKLWATPLSVLVGVAWSILFLWYRYSGFVRSLWSPSLKLQNSALVWRRDIWPMQWRLAITWMSATLTTNLFAPIIFRIDGPEAAGQIGLTATLGMILSAIVSNWSITKAPQLGVLVAKRNYAELDRLFRNIIIVSISSALGGVSILLFAIYILSLLHYSITTRLLPMMPAGFLLFASSTNAVITCIATYLRSHKEEPLVASYLLSSGLVAILAFVLGTKWGALGVSLGYFFVTTLFQLPYSILLFVRFHRSRNKLT